MAHCRSCSVHTNRDDNFDVIIIYTDASKSVFEMPLQSDVMVKHAPINNDEVYDLHYTGIPQGEGTANYFTAQHFARMYSHEPS